MFRIFGRDRLRARAGGRLRPRETVTAVTKDGRTVLLDVDRQRYFGIDEVGTRIWELLAQEESAEAIIARMADEYDAPRERIAADVERFLGGLVTSRLVEAR